MLLVASTALATLASGQAPEEFSPGKLSFSVKVRGETTAYRELAVTVLPEAAMTLEVLPGRAAVFEVTASAGSLRSTGQRKWEWKAPAAPGLYPVTIRATDTGESMQLNAFVLVPRSRAENGRLNGYRIDSYPAIPLRGLEIYKAPRGFIEVTADNVDTRVSPHFTLGQFLCKQSGGYPKYVVLRERLLLKLELLLERVNAAGFRCDTFHVMSGYRTPFYNRSIGNVKYSRHVYGGAADIFIDVNPRDGNMDDLNGDGRVDVHDAGVLYDLIDDLYGTETYKSFIGGLGRYKTTSAHGPFVHVDVRGFRARWGD
ncbi:MAG: D-Ala-D-Ala carboxypeptidase family metallohydrolase [Acidobacteriota bacterium]|nr:D-Ala-D-Ala carboxypeptidase family metallohydrolase [Acidobacteriota bacterium]